MDAERWQLLQELFAAVVERPEDERADYLDRACRDDDELRCEIEKLLDFDTTGPGVVGAAIGRAAHDTVSAAPERIGPYRIARELGRGGMGEVHLAERDDDQFEHRVAIKFVSRGLLNPRIVERFRAERQILARLEHPFIARLIDGGSTESGLPYFVMEYVEGEPIDAYCDRRRLPVRERLQLFRRICSAVETAHRNLVVHRDLKPSNILVTKDGTPKMLDFGIAKLLESDGDGSVTATVMGERVMTPEYASPEQVRGEPVSTATDVYALGLLLDELLTGQRAQPIGSNRPKDIERAVCETTPPRPSEGVARDDDAVDAARYRATSRPKLVRALSGDLDNIVLMALRKEPSRRYGSVSAFSEDVRRHLEGRPVCAHRDSISYRASKFLRRHRVPVAAAALVLLAIVGGLAGTTWQAQRALREARRAEEVSQFLVNLFEVSDPNVSKGETVAARELLGQGAARIERELADQPAVQAELMTVMGTIYLKLGLYETGQPLLEQALALRRQVFSEKHPEVAASLNNLAKLHYLKGDYEAAEPIYRQALAMDRELHGEEHLDVARGLNDLSVVVRARDAFDEAEALARRALAVRRELLGEEHPDIAESLVNIAVPLYLGASYDEAEPLYREALAMQRKLLGEEHLDVAATLNRLALLFRRRAEHEEAAQLYRQTLAIQRKLLGEEHPDVATSLNNLAVVLYLEEEHEEAEALYRQALAIQRKLLGEEHPEVANTLNNLASLLHDQGKYREAETLNRQALALFREQLGEHRHVARSLNNLAQVLLSRSDYAAAESLHREALAMRRKILGEEHPSVVSSRYNLARLLRLQGHYDEAESLYRQALEHYQRLEGEEGYWTLVTLGELGLTTLLQGRNDEALELLGKATARAERGVPDDAQLRGTLLLRQGRALAASGQLATAEERFREAAELLEGEERDEALRRLGEVGVSQRC